MNQRDLALAACQGIHLLPSRLHPFVCAQAFAAVVHSRCHSHAPDERWGLVSHLLSSRKLRDCTAEGNYTVRHDPDRTYILIPRAPSHITYRPPVQVGPDGAPFHIMPKYQCSQYYGVPMETLAAYNIDYSKRKRPLQQFSEAHSGFLSAQKAPVLRCGKYVFFSGGRKRWFGAAQADLTLAR